MEEDCAAMERSLPIRAELFTEAAEEQKSHGSQAGTY